MANEHRKEMFKVANHETKTAVRYHSSRATGGGKRDEREGERERERDVLVSM
jgi:hypothetical protein